MIRFLCIALQLTVLALAGLAVAVFSVSFSPRGLVNTPSRLQAGVFLLSQMPFDGMGFLQSLRILVWVPLVTAGLGYFQGIVPSRLFNWAGIAVNAAALGYLYYIVPAVVSPQKLPWPILTAGMLFICSAALMLAPASRSGGKGARSPALAVLLLLWGGSCAIIGYGAWSENVFPLSLAGIAGTLLGLTVAFYCLGKAVGGLGAKKKSSGASALFVLVPLLLCAACVYCSPPLALPLAAGIFVFLAARLP